MMKKHFHFRIWLRFDYFVCLLLTFAGTTGYLVVRPVNVVTKHGLPATFPCGTNISGVSVTWHHRSPGAEADITRIYDAIDVRDPDLYDVQSSPGTGRYDLLVKSPRFSDAGVYTCRDDDGMSEETASAELTVVAELTCAYDVSDDVSRNTNSVLENSRVSMKCMLVYAGNIVPRVLWTDNNRIPVTISVTAYNTSSQSADQRVNVLSTYIEFTADTSNIFPYRCTVSFHNKSSSSLQWTSSELVVIYAVRELRVNITAVNIYEKGDVLLCSALGSPAVSYYWRDLQTGNITLGPILTLSTAGSRLSYECSASNMIQNKTRTVAMSVAVTVRLPNIHLTSLNVIIILVCSAGGIVPCIVFAVVMTTRPRLRQPSEGEKVAAAGREEVTEAQQGLNVVASCGPDRTTMLSDSWQQQQQPDDNYDEIAELGETNGLMYGQQGEVYVYEGLQGVVSVQAHPANNIYAHFNVQ